MSRTGRSGTVGRLVPRHEQRCQRVPVTEPRERAGNVRQLVVRHLVQRRDLADIREDRGELQALVPVVVGELQALELPLDGADELLVPLVAGLPGRLGPGLFFAWKRW